MLLYKNKIYISPFDLNIEHNLIEVPFKPTIRFCKPVFDKNGKKRGIIVLNYLGNNFLNKIPVKKTSDLLGNIISLNQKGYYLKSDDNNKNFGFMFHNKLGETFVKYYNEEWNFISSNDNGKIVTKNGLFTFLTISPGKFNIAEAPSWKLIAHVTSQILYAQFKTVNKMPKQVQHDCCFSPCLSFRRRSESPSVSSIQNSERDVETST